ncbi:MAG TPA: S46 family peptidase [Candidatus Krumholzibacteria bacterium]|nr:S46 family peptidase [Candidatus Krumholzibacteria bacterium]
MPSRIAAPLFAVLCLLSAPAGADEGMWMPQQIPMLGDELRELGLELDPDSFADLTDFPMGAIVSLGGCSAAFVSDQGLIVTNHHCVYGSLQYNSTPERDYVADGFLAATLDDEVLASPTARVYVTTAIEDVTAEITGGLEDVGDTERAERVEERRKAMVAACESATDDVRCWVRSFFEGETYLKITAMEIRDVRLVYAPAQGVGNFGGEVDNWMWPRHTGDFAFYRAYVGPDGRPADFSPENVPYRPEHHLEISTRDLDPGDLVLLAGYPGRTRRLATATEVREAQEWDMPTSVRYREELATILEEQGEADREVQLANASRIRGLRNYQKKYGGTLEAFERDDPLAHKRAQERALERYVADDEDMAEDYRRARDEFEALLARERATRERDTVFRWLDSASPLLGQADLLVRMAEERTKPDAERDEGYQERDWPRREAGLRRAQRSIHVGSDRAGLEWILRKAVQLPGDQRIPALDTALAATGAETDEARIQAVLDTLYDGTRLHELDLRQELFTATVGDLRELGDTFLDLAFELRGLAEELEDRAEEHAGARLRLRPRLVAAQRAMLDGRLAPDANGTLRVGFGVVEGYRPRDGVEYQPQTTVRGVLEKDTGERPFDSPRRLLEMARAGRFGPYVDPDLRTLPVAFLSTVNVTNGSSGSSALNARGEVIGLAFDMNWEGVAADWVVNEDVVRTIQVDSRYMLWVMDAVDGAHRILEEMGIRPQFRRPAGRR